jgi:8-oxo-dGTP pyrophosphatase MutT (NUDIX family)
VGSKQAYTLGFGIGPFQDDIQTIMVRKRASSEVPASVRGMLNAPGGHVEPNEMPVEGMIREYEEETGLYVAVQRWHQFATVFGNNYRLHCFRAVISPIEFGAALMHTGTSEPTEAVSIPLMGQMNDLALHVVWLAPMACDMTIKGCANIHLEGA